MRITLVMAGSIALAGAICPVPRALGQVNLPNGFEIVEFGFSEKKPSVPALNDCGQIVYHTGRNQPSAAEIFLYDNGRIVQLTSNDVADFDPDINDAGTIVWDRGDDGKAGTIVRLRDGKLTELGTGSGAEINNREHVAWYHFREETCEAESDIYLYKRGRTRLILSDGLSSQGPRLNDRGDIVWDHCHCCAQPWWSDVMLYRDRRIKIINPDPGNPKNQYGGQHINNRGVVTWGIGHEIYVWENGETRKVITGRPSGWGSLNDHGDIFFWRWYQETRTFDAWLYRVSGGEPTFHRLTDDSQEDGLGNVNNFGEVVWWWAINLREGFDGGIRYLRRVRTGDSEFDGDIDRVDYVAFVDCMTGPGRVDRLCDCRFLDIDYDGDVDLGDFALFQSAFTGE